MTWFKVDDGFWSHPKTATLSDAAVTLWVRAGAYSCQHLTDGVIARPVLRLVGTEGAAGELVAAGLWVERSDGWRFHDWDEYQETSDAVKKRREATRERQRRARERREQSRGASQSESPVTGGVTDGVSAQPPTRPDPTRPVEEPDGSSSSELRPDVEGLLDLLDVEIRKNGGRVPNRTKKNRDAARLLLDRDGKTVDQVEAAIRWCQADEFWRANVLSMSKLREKYDQLRLAAGRSQKTTRTFAQQQQESSLALVERLREKERHEGIGSGSAAGVRELDRGSGDDGSAGRRVA